MKKLFILIFILFFILLINMKEKIEIQKIIDEKFNDFSPIEKVEIHKRYLSYMELAKNDPDTYQKTLKTLQKVIFKKIPPTGKEFLEIKNGWIPRLNIWPHIRKDFLDIVDGGKTYQQLSFYGATRLGKSFLARLLILYTIVYIHHLRKPALYYGLSENTPLAIYFISFKFAKTRQLYLNHIYKMMENAPRYIKIKFQDKVQTEQNKYGCEKIVWSKASLVGEITLSSNLQILLGNDNPNEIIGADVLQCYISEIAYFIEEAGTNEEDIFKLYTNAIDRIQASVGNDYLTWIFLDSSANHADSKIEKHIIKKLQFDKNTYFTWRSRWDVRPKSFPKWNKGVKQLEAENFPIQNRNEELVKRGFAFKVITGNGTIPAKIVTHPSQLTDIPIDIIDYVPIDAYKRYLDPLVKSIKDIGGKPTSNESKFIQVDKYVTNLYNNPHLVNIEGAIVADTSDLPEGLIWDQIEHIFFIKNLSGSTVIKRAPNEPRFIAFDTAYAVSGDIYGICMGHLEYSRVKQDRIFVVDFNFPVTPGKEGINLTAGEQFIMDIIVKGNVYVMEVNSDTFQSQQTIQNLKRARVNVRKQSVDSSLEPYVRLSTSLVNETIKSGKNIFSKNNLKCLERVRNDKGKEKIDHPSGPTNNKYYGDWDNSTCGINGKDVSDPLASASFTAFETDILPVTMYEDENKRVNLKEEDTLFQDQIDSAFDRIRGVV